MGGVCGEGSLRVRCGLGEETVLAGGRGDLEWGRQGAGRIEWDGKSGHKQYLWVYLIKMCRMSEKICIFALRKNVPIIYIAHIFKMVEKSKKRNRM